MKLVKKGAEADIYRGSWNGKSAIIKVRKPKGYRVPQLDARIRRQRTSRESQMLSHARSLGVTTPLVYLVDTEKSAIIMQDVPGAVVQSLPDDDIVGLSARMGRMVGILHRSGIMHGDLTTSNFVYDGKQDALYMIDFGLSQNTCKPEDHAVDMRLIKEILNSAHARIMAESWKKLLQGYARAVGYERRAKIVRLVSVIEGRGRYATVV